MLLRAALWMVCFDRRAGGAIARWALVKLGLVVRVTIEKLGW